MGQFSFMRADNLTRQRNFCEGDAIKILIPKEFGGPGYIKGHYDGYGRIDEADGDSHDVYEILAVMNRNYMDRVTRLCWPNESLDVKETDVYTTSDGDRNVGINIGCYDDQHKALKYKLKLVSVGFKGTYEDIDDTNFSKADSVQGFHPVY